MSIFRAFIFARLFVVLALLVAACTDGSGATTTSELVSASPKSPPTTSSSTTTSSTTTSTSTTTTTVATDALVSGAWVASDVDGSTIGVAFAGGAVFESYDSSSTTCEGQDLPPSPWSWVGSWTNPSGDVVAVVGDTTCYLVGGESQQRGEDVQNEFEYVREDDSVVFLADGARFDRVDDTVAGVWHRLSGGSHEIAFCEVNGPDVTCYMVLGLASTDAVVGEFIGTTVDACVSFDPTICDDAITVTKGVASLSRPNGTPIGTIDQLFVVHPDGALTLQWTTTSNGLPGGGLVPFHCPWYRTWDAARNLPGECTFG